MKFCSLSCLFVVTVQLKVKINFVICYFCLCIGPLPTDKQKPEPVKTGIVIKTESSQPQNPLKSRAVKHSSLPENGSLKDISDDVVEVKVAAVVPEVIDLTEEEESEGSCQTESKQLDKVPPYFLWFLIPTSMYTHNIHLSIKRKHVKGIINV